MSDDLERMKDRIAKLKQSHLRGSIDAHLAGRAAGDKVELHRPVGTTNQGKLT